MADNKEFYVNISFSGRLGISVSAENEEEALDKVMDSLGTMTIESKDKDVYIDDIEWDLLKEEPRGNTATPFVRDVEITED
jgi:predicted AAA+ superfamily ATPase